MKRSNRVKTYLSFVYEIIKENKNQDMYNRFYDFLVEKDIDMDFVSEEMSINFKVEVEDIMAHKNEMILEIVKGYYSALRLYQTTGDVNEEEEIMIRFFDSGKFSFTDIAQYFSIEENKEIAIKMIELYCISNSQSNEFTKKILDYNDVNQTPFLAEINKAVKYLDIIDEMSGIYAISFPTEDLDKKTEDEELYQDDEVVLEKINEIRDKVLYLLEDYFGVNNSEEKDNFIGYYLSLAYAILLEQKEMHCLIDGDFELFELFENEDLSHDDIISSLYDDENEYLFLVVELVSQEYLESKGEDYDYRYRMQDKDEKKIIQFLDPKFIYSEYAFEENKIERYILNNSQIDKFDMFLEKLKMDYSKGNSDFKIEIFNIITGMDNGIFYELDIDDNDIVVFRINLARYLIRSFYEYSLSTDSSLLNLQEKSIKSILDKSEINLEMLAESFYRNGLVYIDTYFKMSNRSEKSQRDAIRNFDLGTKQKLAKIDPSVLGDSIYYKALFVDELYLMMENYGVNNVLDSLSRSYDLNKSKCESLISELMSKLYYLIEENYEKEDIDYAFIGYISLDNPNTLEEITKDLCSNQELLSKFLNRYFELEKANDYPAVIDKEKILIEFGEKIKTKLFPKESK